MITAARFEDSPEILQEHCGCGGGGSGRGSAALFLMCAVRTKPCSVLAERKLLMRLDGVCRHYLAMTKSALFLFAHGGKNSTGAPSEKKHLQAAAVFASLFFCLPLFTKKMGGGYSCIRDRKVAATVAKSGSLFCLFFKMLLGPEDATTVCDFKTFMLLKS